jgi:ribosome biogenesis GTPase
MRSIGVFDADDGLERALEEIDRLALECRFGDCSHEVEPGCAVLAAIAAGTLPADRLRARRKLQRELGALALRSDPVEQRRSAKRFGKMVREAGRAAEAKRSGWASR